MRAEPVDEKTPAPTFLLLILARINKISTTILRMMFSGKSRAGSSLIPSWETSTSSGSTNSTAQWRRCKGAISHRGAGRTISTISDQFFGFLPVFVGFLPIFFGFLLEIALAAAPHLGLRSLFRLNITTVTEGAQA